MATPLWEAESPAGVPELSRVVAGVEERTGTRDVARNGISFPSAGVRKVDSLSEGLRGLKNRKVSDIRTTIWTAAAVSDWLICFNGQPFS